MTALADQLPFWHFDGELMIFKDGSLGAGYRIAGFDNSSATTDEANTLAQCLENMLLSCDQGVRFQTYYDLRGDVTHLLEKHRGLIDEENEGYREVAQSRTNFLSAEAKGGRFYAPLAALFVRSAPKAYKKRRFLEKREAFAKISRDEFDERVSGFSRLLQQVESTLQGAGLAPEKLSADEWFSLLSLKLNEDRFQSP